MSSSPKKTSSIWTPANIVTMIRILLVPVFFVAFVSPWPDWIPDWDEAEIVKPWLAALLFVVLSCTDALDGYLARSRGEVTNFGKFMDPLADKILVAAALLALCELQILPAWVALVILVREFIVSGLRMLAASEGVVIAASWYGKAKTVFQIIAIVLFIIKDSHPFTTDPALETPLYVISWIFMSIALILTIVSMLDYIAKSRWLLKPSESRPDSEGTSRQINSGTPSFRDELLEPSLRLDSLELVHLKPLAKEVINAAITKGVKLSTAESCTGGLIAGMLTAVPGSSEVVEGGVVSYSNEVKHSVLGVSSVSLESFGAVSEEVAQEMAQGSRELLKSSIAVSVTGIAGPGGAVPGKPVGTVWFGVSIPTKTFAECKHFDGDRDDVRSQTVEHALELFKAELDKF